MLPSLMLQPGLVVRGIARETRRLSADVAAPAVDLVLSETMVG